MAIKGNLREASLPDVLQLLAMGQKTGCLRSPTAPTSATSTSTAGASPTRRSSTGATGWATCW